MKYIIILIIAISFVRADIVISETRELKHPALPVVEMINILIGVLLMIAGIAMWFLP